jgi:hypothetical protein
MKFNTIRLILLLCVISFTLSLGTSTSTATSTNTHTNTKTQAKTSIFSYDFLSVMKKKMQMLKAKGLSSNKETYKSERRNDSPPVASEAQPTASNSPSGDQAEQAPSESPVNSEAGPIFYNGWLKFFKFDERLALDGSKPNSFFKNHEFTNQRRTVKNLDLEARDKDGIFENVPEESYFFATLFKNKLVFANSKREKVKKAFETLDLDDVTPVPEGDKFGGGLKDMGNFSEGYCFKINTRQFMTWILCAENEGEKSKLMELIKRMKITSQRENGMLVGDESVLQKKDTNGNSIARMINPKEETEKRRKNLPKQKANVTSAFAEDGYWIVLQDWSQCSKKCDGGISTLHRLCIPPKNGGKPCDGKAVTTRPCNSQPCPKSGQSKELDAALNGGKTLKPIIKVMPFTNRPTRTRVCIIKEGDLMLTKPQPEPTYVGAPKLPIEQVPVRAIMNNRTISFYENADDMTSHFATYNLKTADFSRSERDKFCFVISENKKSTELCGIGLDKDGKIYNEWDKDFHIFKFNCETKPDKIDLLLNAKLKDKIREAKDQMLIEREEMVKEQTKKEEENNKFSILKKTNKIAQDAISKEQSMEELIQKEEEERERREEIQLQEQIEKEKKKNVNFNLNLGMCNACN